MCGIAGLIRRDGGTPEMAQLEAMARALVHRGPDGEGFHISGSVGLAHRRLSIVDLEGGSQPMSSPDGRVTVSFNGEIYNHAALRKDLESKGHRFRTSSDTEVLPALWVEHGPAMLDKLSGMFAIALHDAAKGQVMLATDRFGKKPLYYRHDSDLLAFASEPRALHALPGRSWSLDLPSLHHYLSFLSAPSPRTLVREIQRLGPATRLMMDLGSGEIKEDIWWRAGTAPEWQGSLVEAHARLRHLLTQAVHKRLMSDVPLGAFLSGGLDSTIVVGLMAKLMNQPVKTFTITTGEPGWDEGAMALESSHRFGTEHHEEKVAPEAASFLTNMSCHLGEPFADSSLLPTDLVSAFARRHVTVALTGDGADEAFGGYSRYRALLMAEQLDVLGAPARALAAGLARIMPRGTEERTTLRALHRFLTMFSATDLERYHGTISQMDEAQKRSLYTEATAMTLLELRSIDVLEADFARARVSDTLGRVQRLDLRRYLHDDILTKVDRASMHHSLECRAPFLDHEVVDFALSLPRDWRTTSKQGKVILREAFADLIPPGHLRAPKRGFAVPLGRWFRGPLRELAGDLLLSPRTAQRGIFSGPALKNLLENHWAGKADHGQKLWALCMLEAWLRGCFDKLSSSNSPVMRT
ncbi:MAG: asparagine synthase (glutamine-hydrolyzing) [Planctomycetota bacterium]